MDALSLPLCIVLQNYGLVKRGKNCINFSVPEVKMLMLVSSFFIYGIITLVILRISIVNQSQAFFDDIIKYAICQLGGLNPMCEDIRQQFEKHLHPELEVADNVCFALVTWMYLLFAIQVQDIKRLLQGVVSCYHGIAKVLSLKANSSSDKSVESSATPRPVES